MGIGLIIGAASIPTLLACTIMNLNFMLAGTVRTNPILYTATSLLLIAEAAGYYYGADRWILPVLKLKVNRNIHPKKMITMNIFRYGVMGEQQKDSSWLSFCYFNIVI